MKDQTIIKHMEFHGYVFDSRTTTFYKPYCNEIKPWDDAVKWLNDLEMSNLTQEELENNLDTFFGADTGTWENKQWLKYKAEFDKRGVV